MVLFKNPKIEVRKSPLHGFGVFANADIKKGEILEECSYVRLYGMEENVVDVSLESYYYGWPKNPNSKYTTIVFGYGSIYNCAKSEKKRLVDYNCDEEKDVYVFKAIKNIKANTEILSYYGDNWWMFEDYKKKLKLHKYAE